jgi:hypothetical protein
MRSLVVGMLALALTACGGDFAPDDARVAAAAPRQEAGGCDVFPEDNYWHADVSGLRRHPRSRQWLRRMSPDSRLHPDFGPSYGDGPNYGMPVTVVKHSHRRVRVRFQYASESDRVRYPFGRDTQIEGGRDSSGDKHAIVVDRGVCRLYETWNTRLRDGRWRAGSGATWRLDSNALRPDGWTSADAAGLPILPGLLRWREVMNRNVDHAIRFTTDVTSRWHVWPARHDAGSRASHRFPPMGARFRLKAGYRPPKGLGAGAREVVRAMKTYGLVLADNGSPWFFQGEQNRAWPDRLVADLKRIPASAFVAVDTRPLMVDRDSAQVQ